MQNLNDIIGRPANAKQQAYLVAMAAESACDSPAPRDAMIAGSLQVVEQLDQVLASLQADTMGGEQQ